MADPICLYLLGQARVARGAQRRDGADSPLSIQPRLLRLLAYLALNWRRLHYREELQVLFWPDKPPDRTANSLRQALWHLRQALPPECLWLEGDTVQWNPAAPPWVDALAFEAALDADDLDAALNLYTGPLLPDAYDEWVQQERERLALRYLHALEKRAERFYEERRWQAALADAQTLLTDDPLNEVAVRLSMACYWALGRREAARRCYDGYRQRVRRELQASPSPEATALYQRILRGESHPDQSSAPSDPTIATHAAYLSLLETLGAFRKGLERATAWVAESSGPAQSAALRWQGCFYMRLGQSEAARTALTAALPLASVPDLQAKILADLATVETALGNYSAAEAYYAQALRLPLARPLARLQLLCGLGGLSARMGHLAKARKTLAEAVRLARQQSDPAALAIASGNLGLLLIEQKETPLAETVLQEALAAARQSEAHWLAAHLTGHLGVLAQDRNDLDRAAEHYQVARALTQSIGDPRGLVLWTINLGIVRYEQGRWSEALPLLAEGKDQAAAQGSRSLEAGALIFVGASLSAQGEQAEGLASIERGLALAQSIHDQERILIGYLHRGRALMAMGRIGEAGSTLEEGLRLAEQSQMNRLAEYLRAELLRVHPRA